MAPALPEPGPSHDVRSLFLSYLDFYRETVAAKVSELSDSDLRATRLPSGWSPVELVKHLVHMERRWLVWGFLGEEVDHPWAGAPPPSLAAVLFHVLQEYARHAGHLDIARELIDGQVGE